MSIVILNLLLKPSLKWCYKLKTRYVIEIIEEHVLLSMLRGVTADANMLKFHYYY